MLLSLLTLAGLATGPDDRSPTLDELLQAVRSDRRDVVAEWLATEPDLERGLPHLGGRSVLHVAAEEGRCEIVELLIDAGADLGARTDHGWTPLHLATPLADARMAELLLARGAQIEVADERGATPLHHAAQFGRVDLVRELLERGGEDLASARDARGWTARDRAAAFLREECAVMLGATDGPSPPGVFGGMLREDAAPVKDTEAVAERVRQLVARRSRSRGSAPRLTITSKPSNGPPAQRNVPHVIAAVWNDGLFVFRNGVLASEAGPVPSMRIGFLDHEGMEDLERAVEDSEVLDEAGEFGDDAVCLPQRFEVEWVDADRRAEVWSLPVFGSRPSKSQRLGARLREDACWILGRYLERELGPRTLPLASHFAGRSLRGVTVTESFEGD